MYTNQSFKLAEDIMANRDDFLRILSLNVTYSSQKFDRLQQLAELVTKLQRDAIERPASVHLPESSNAVRRLAGGG